MRTDESNKSDVSTLINDPYNEVWSPVFFLFFFTRGKSTGIPTPRIIIRAL